MRRTLFVIAVLTALVPTAGMTATAQITPLAQFSGYSTGTAIHADALQFGTTRLENAEVAFSGANVNSGGIGAPLVNEMEQAYQTVAGAGHKSAGRGSGLEIGLATTVPNDEDANQVNPGSTVQAFAPVSTDLLTAEFTPVDQDPIVNASLLRGQAQAIYSDSVCVLGQPISSGLGYAADTELVNSDDVTLLASDTDDNAVNQSRSFTYLIPNNDGTYGLVTETRQILAPITLFAGTPVPLITIEFAGEWVLRSTATGHPGGAEVHYGPEADSPDTKVIVVMLGETEAASFTTQELALLGPEGLVVEIPGLGEIAIGEDPRAIGGNADSAPELAADGTMAAAAVDVARINLSGNLLDLDLDTLDPLDLIDPDLLDLDIDIADLRVGHMESMATVPAGGIQCGIPVSKTGTPASVVAGQEQVLTHTITVPADIEAFKAVACDLLNIRVTDVTTAEPGVKFDIVSASNDGVISGNTVTWENLGTYSPGDQPIVLTVELTVPADSAAGKITDTATATAVLGNCTGNASADSDSLTGLAQLDSAALTGSATTIATTTAVDPAPAILPATDFGPTPIGGVATGAGGTSDPGRSLLPIAAALGGLALAGTAAGWQRRRIG